MVYCLILYVYNIKHKQQHSLRHPNFWSTYITYEGIFFSRFHDICLTKLFEEMNKETYYLLTPWSRVLLEKLTGFAASQEIPPIYGTRKFITVLTSARHLSLS
jgi:hypothetical protein